MIKVPRYYQAGLKIKDQKNFKIKSVHLEMKRNMIKLIIKLMLKFFGLELHKIKKGTFLVQKRLLNGMETPVIFDVGAYVGQITAKYKTLFPGATIYSFEPFPDSFRKLQGKFKAYDLVKPFQLAIADRAGTREFYVNSDRSCNSLFPRPSSARKYWSGKAASVARIEVDVTTIDTFCKKETIPKIDILKLDVEGAELLALRGASEKLARKLIELIYTEVMFIPHYERGVMFYELCSFLSDYGYTLFDLYNLKRAENGQLRWGNAIFVSPHIRASVIDAQ